MVANAGEVSVACMASMILAKPASFAERSLTSANAVSRLHSVNQWIGRAGRGPRSIQDVIGLAKPRQLARKAVEHRTIARQLGTDSDFDCDRIAGVESARRNHGCECVAFKAPSRSARAFGARQGFLVDTHCRWRPTPREAKFVRPFVWHTGVMT